MKRITTLLLALVIAAMMVSPCSAGGGSMRGLSYLGTGNFTARLLGSNWDWTYGFKALVYGTADDTITITIVAGDGVTPVWTGTTTGATSGEVLDLEVVPIPPKSTIAVSGIGTGTANIYITTALY
jgi:hypothetical protein